MNLKLTIYVIEYRSSVKVVPKLSSSEFSPGKLLEAFQSRGSQYCLTDSGVKATNRDFYREACRYGGHCSRWKCSASSKDESETREPSDHARHARIFHSAFLCLSIHQLLSDLLNKPATILTTLVRDL